MNREFIISYNHPLIHNHQVNGQAMLPGLAYIDLIFQIFREQNLRYSHLIMKKLTIFNSLIVLKDEEIALTIEAEESDTGIWKVRIRGKSVSVVRDALLYATVEIHPCKSLQFDEVIDCQKIVQSALHAKTLQSVYEQWISRNVIHKDFMQAKGNVYEYNNAICVQAELHSDALESAEGFMFHPALLDGCGAGVIGSWYEDLLKDDTVMFLPLYFESFRATELMDTSSWAKVDISSIVRSGDLLSYTMGFFNHHGQKIAELINFTLKLIRNLEEKNITKPDLYIKHSDELSTIHEVEASIVCLIADYLELETIKIRKDIGFFEMGLHSVDLLNLAVSIEQSLDKPISPTLLFEHSTITQLVQYLTEQGQIDLNKLRDTQDTSINSSLTEGMNIEARESTVPLANSDIAVIGMSGRYPQARNIEEFWSNLKAGVDAITEVTLDRWNWKQTEDLETPSGKSISRWGGFVEDYDCFDASFFRITPKEAEAMDPQERLFLEVCWEAIEDAGYTPKNIVKSKGKQKRNKVGVFAGVMHKDYAFLGAEAVARGQAVSIAMNDAPIANRISYFCNFHGPSMTIDTVCSSSLTAVHLAMQSLRLEECEVALAGGVNLSLHPNKYISYGFMGMHASDGRCRSFGKDGDGYVSSDGVGTVVLKPLKNAVEDGDHIYAVIKGSAINHVGAGSGITVPSPVGQAELIRDCLEKANIKARTISYIEAHGTGTSLGDPIEMEGLIQAFNQHTEDKQFCSIGSVKSNIGHAESAAGISGLQKSILQLYHRTLVPSLHVEEANPYIDFIDSPFRIQTQLEAWSQPFMDIDGVQTTFPRRAGLSSFGATGSNAHLIMEEYIPNYQLDGEQPRDPFNQIRPSLVPVSAKNEEQLHQYVVKIMDYLILCTAQVTCSEYRTKMLLEDVAFTLQTGREAWNERVIFISNDIEELIHLMEQFLKGDLNNPQIYRGQSKQSPWLSNLFADDMDTQALLDQWMHQGKWGKIASLWTHGVHVHWNELLKNQEPHRISLPTYPFVKERYWLPQEQETSKSRKQVRNTHTSEHPLHPGQSRHKKILQKQWRISKRSKSNSSLRSLCILASEHTMVLASELARLVPGSHILTIEAPVKDEDREWGAYSGFVDITGCAVLEDESLAWISCLQNYVEYADSDRKIAILITKGLESYKNITPRLHGASRVGLYRMLQSEYGEVCSRHVDVDVNSSDETIAIQILNELHMYSEDSEACYREGTRYEAYLAELPLHGPHIDRKINFIKGVLWITGGTRGIGALCAKHFVEHYGVRKIVLTGREVLPPREQWEDLDKEMDSTTFKKIEAILALEALGAEVKTFALDLTDVQEVQQTVNKVKEQWGPIQGVLHSAGLGDLDTPAFIRKSLGTIETVLAPKIKGLDCLYQSMRGEPLLFFILFSSVSAIVPSLASGQSDYAMANSYMDYMAQAHRNEHRIISIQWPSWKEVGLGEVKSTVYNHSGLWSHTNDEGLQLLDYVIANDVGAVVLPAIVNPLLWNPSLLMKRTLLSGISESTHTDNRVNKSMLSQHSPLKKSSQVGENGEPPSLLKSTEAWVSQLFASELKLKEDHLDAQMLFSEYGVDSILLTQVLRSLRNEMHIDLAPSILYEYPSVSLFAAWLEENHQATLREMFKRAVRTDESVTLVDWFIESDASTDNSPSRLIETQSTLTTCPEGYNIAIVGMSCQFPGARTLDEYWELLSQGRSAIQRVPADFWPCEERYYAGLLDRSTRISPEYFHISEQDAKAMDPQALLLLEESLKLLHHAGYTTEEIKGQSVGVYVGARSQHVPDERDLIEANHPIVAFGANYLAANISHYFDLHGPSLVVDTACSSSLVGMNIAIQALQRGDINSALVGGVSMLSSDRIHRLFQQRGILCPTSEFHVFDAKANGVVLSEGIGMVMLKSVEQAVKDGDCIYAVISGMEVNNDGRTAGPAAPNVHAQMEVMRKAIVTSGKSPQDIRYIEANGSGSEITDLLELKAIEQVYRNDSNMPLGIGSIKPNIGHPLCAEGMAGLIKIVCMLEQQVRLPFISGQSAMKHYDLDQSPIYFDRAFTPWEGNSVAALNCFADGGTNVHVILERWIEKRSVNLLRKPLPLPVRMLEHTDFLKDSDSDISNWWRSPEINVRGEHG
ncbi:acyl transferase domain-containing protein/acyl carrier protein/NAD(P)-dependent dehydrogenase (short-subunit alcohol dehydrogenase family) [Paenibacillus shirakamiensis]|uniref:Acyl transferase domain-containing protein/acyl carrier protein/NAD(P)-dependent dehydrogenase (Short-subunit alcohol dehydrogenase family) n=1 Tax=Paenibacillus shirakamiensis TaxID=1265935 RepID=A0ABS4JEM3_9BACL|nr:SDR family NAD(P)-dependent oxidoreductase [Paenibacillus shirakamiensis]MBP2000172.1 acyl transferase domain-containing protein/acyl carrier protein/NAD(P)-dependent dehydrogenase (short-subunit alcohol dehydrogenase family) [Paenibacillus shirakamiensis]